MGYFSISAYAQSMTLVPEAKAILEPGINVFTVVSDDIDLILVRLRTEGVRILSCQQLDVFNEVPNEYRTAL